MKSPKADFTLLRDGSLFLFVPLTPAATTWLEEHCSAAGEHQYLGPNLVVEHRYIGDVVNYAVQDGLQPRSK